MPARKTFSLCFLKEERSVIETLEEILIANTLPLCYFFFFISLHLLYSDTESSQEIIDDFNGPLQESALDVEVPLGRLLVEVFLIPLDDE